MKQNENLAENGVLFFYIGPYNGLPVLEIYVRYMKKQYQDIEAQITNLVKNKNVMPETIDRRCFGEKTYLDLITPYSDLIAIGRTPSGKHIYPEHVDFAEYLEWNRIDFAICHYLHVLIGCFEKTLKNFLMHTYCKKMKASGDRRVNDYSWIDRYCSGEAVFDLPLIHQRISNGKIGALDKEEIRRRVDALGKLKSFTKDPRNSVIARHFKGKYGYVPMFVAIHGLSFGELVKLFEMLPRGDKMILMRQIHCSPDRVFTDSQIGKFQRGMARIRIIRNIINHYEPIFPFFKNYDMDSFNSLTSVLAKLKQHYVRSASYPLISFGVQIMGQAKNSYSVEFHRKIEMVVAALK